MKPNPKKPSRVVGKPTPVGRKPLLPPKPGKVVGRPVPLKPPVKNPGSGQVVGRPPVRHQGPGTGLAPKATNAARQRDMDMMMKRKPAPKTMNSVKSNVAKAARRAGGR